MKVRQLVAKIVIAFSDEFVKVRLCLQNLQWYVRGQVGEDAFLGLELQAADRMKAKQSQP